MVEPGLIPSQPRLWPSPTRFGAKWVEIAKPRPHGEQTRYPKRPGAFSGLPATEWQRVGTYMRSTQCRSTMPDPGPQLRTNHLNTHRTSALAAGEPTTTLPRISGGSVARKHRLIPMLSCEARDPAWWMRVLDQINAETPDRHHRR
jgi:hypothetical protein